ncbi:sirohydrochlorin cobaltochelatase [Falsiporphyromonas endometrii]|uniref:Sirohydrochlorin cobaltochelatase n=1 Tax=Falsiporphyromonas endometrii TaxID=1387297 RepID=A0ABV9K8A8_9PORP
MKKFLMTALGALMLTALLSACSSSDNEPIDENSFDGIKGELAKAAKIDKKHDSAILLVTFGSTWDNAHETYKKVVDQFKKDFPDQDVYLAFTSKICITRWGAKTKEYFPTPDFWFRAMKKAGYKKIHVQSLHVIPGEEFAMLRDWYVKDFNLLVNGEDAPKDGNIFISLGKPLLDGEESINKVADILYNQHKEDLANGKAVAFMGHGNPEQSYAYGNKSYEDLYEVLQKKENGNHIFVGTVDHGSMKIDFVIKEAEKNFKKGGTMILQPIMSIAGDHAHNDMAGNEEDSWKMLLRQAGFNVPDNDCIMKGLGDYPEIVKVWEEHLKESMDEQFGAEEDEE